MKVTFARLAAGFGALLLIAGLTAPAAAAVSRASAPVAAPQTVPAFDWWGTTKNCGKALLPSMNPIENGVKCFKGAAKGTVEVHKKAATVAAKSVANSVLGDAAKSMAEFAAEFMKVGFGWWLMTDSVQVKDSGVLGCNPESDKCDPKDPTKQLSLHALMVGIGAGIATILVMFQGIKMIIQRKGAPLTTVLQGLMINVLVSAAGVGVIDALLIASDQLTEAILYVGFGGDDVPERMAVMLLPAISNPMGLLVIALVVLIIGGMQLIMLFLRQAAIPIQALLLPIAGAGQVGGDSARQWLPKLFTSIMVVIMYKPMAALIISVGFTEMAHGNGLIDFLRGVVTLVLSVVALKSLLALFAPFGLTMGNAVSSGGGLGGALSMIGGAMGAGPGGGPPPPPPPGGGPGGGPPDGPGPDRSSGNGLPSSAVSHAAHMDRNGPASGDDATATASVPQQGQGQGQEMAEAGAESSVATAAEGTTAAVSTGQTAAAGGSTTAMTSAGGPVTVSLVAAEAGKQAINKAGGTAGGTE